MQKPKQVIKRQNSDLILLQENLLKPRDIPIKPKQRMQLDSQHTELVSSLQAQHYFVHTLINFLIKKAFCNLWPMLQKLLNSDILLW